MNRFFIVFLATAWSAWAAEPALKVSLLEANVCAIRVSHLDGSFANELNAGQKVLSATNSIAGTVLDLRFATGDDSTTVPAAANWFAINKTPLAILVNGETRGAAVALAALLQKTHAGLIFGSATSGTTRDGPVQPDLAVKVGLADERALINNPYATPALASTNPPAATNDLLVLVDHLSEAELVRRRMKDGEDGEKTIAMPRPVPAQPVIRDPALARAVDLIKALALLHPAHG